MVQYDAVVLIDADVAVTGSLSPLFSLPFEFAASWDQSKWLNRCEAALTEQVSWVEPAGCVLSERCNYGSPVV